MAPEIRHTDMSKLECCPPLKKVENCDSLDIKYRLPFRPRIGEEGKVIPVEVLLHFRLRRCSDGLALGDLAYSTTLLPGEKVRIRTSDRHTRFSYDTETNLAYHHEVTSEESFFMAGMANAVSDLSIVEKSAVSSHFSESSTSAGGGIGISLFGLEIGGGASGSSYSASSAHQFARSVSRHAETSSRHMELGVRSASSTSIGEVERRTHAEGESESHYEASTRLIENLNRCHAVTYFFYKLNKLQIVTFELVAIERRVEDPAAPTGAVPNLRFPSAKVSVLPRSVAATAKNRLEVERNDRVSFAEAGDKLTAAQPYWTTARLMTVTPQEPFSDDDQRTAIEAVDKELVSKGLLNEKTREPDETIKKEVYWRREFTLPTAGIIVKTCLDECNACEPTLRDEILIDLERKKLENQMLSKQVELLEKSQEYRCCPQGMVEEEGDDEG